MTIADNSVVSFHYDLFTASGDMLESSRDGDPQEIAHGPGGHYH